MSRLGVVFVALLTLAPGTAGAALLHKAGTGFVPAPPGAHAVRALSHYRYALVQLDLLRGQNAAPMLRRSGAELVSKELALWRVRSDAAQRLIPRLTKAGLLRTAEPDRVYRLANHLGQGDALVPQEWWLRAIGADRAEPPGPGVPVTVVDDGLDIYHKDFLGRPNTILLNAQTIGAIDSHGTAVSSVVGAAANGIGLVGVYPQAVLQSWDATPTQSEGIATSDWVKGVLAAANKRPGVINLSLGGTGTSAIALSAILAAFAKGSIVVAAAGNEYAQGNPVTYPASYPHVLTVAATNEQNQSSAFSNQNNAIDLAAPGQDITVAVPPVVDPSGYAVWDGTSFSAPMVSAAAAWVWTTRPNLNNTQVFDLMRYSATDLPPAGFDVDTGFGLLNIPQALSAPAPAPDPQEPNDDVTLVKPGGLTAVGKPQLTAPGRLRASLSARMDFTEDPEDVYRAWLPGRKKLVVTLRPTGRTNVDVAVWGTKTRTVFEQGAAQRRDLIAAGTRAGTTTERVTVTNRNRRGRIIYVDAFLGPRAGNGSYNLTVQTQALR